MTEQMSQQTNIKPLLTIAIPTYNRAVYLRELLSVLFDQLVDEPRVELIISDNASSDETASLVEEYQRYGLQIRSVRNKVNIGADANFMQCIEIARGKYFWLFGDDDIIVPGGISKILPLLEGNDYALVYVTPYVFRRDYIAEKTSDKFGRFAEVLPNGLHLTRRVGAMLGFISAVIVNKTSFDLFVRYPLPKLIGTNLMQMGWVCPLLASGLPVLVVLETILAGRGGNSVGWGACQVFGVNLKQVAEATTENRNNIATELCNCTLQKWFPGTIMEIRRGMAGELLQEDMHATLAPVYKTNWRYWVYVYPLIAAPIPVARGWHFLIRIANRIERMVSTAVGCVLNRRKLLDNPRPEHDLALGQ